MDPDSRERYFRRQKELAKKEQITPETQKLLNAIRSDSVPEITAIFTHKKSAEPEKADARIAQEIIDEAKKGTLVKSETEESRFVSVRTNARKIIVVGDVQGAFDEMIESLLCAGIIVKKTSQNVDLLPEYDRYEINPDLPKGTQIVFIGDYFDRGPKGMEALRFVQTIKQKAENKGNVGVTALIGNHEVNWLRLIDLMGDKPQSEMEEALSLRGSIKEREFKSLRGTSLEDRKNLFELGFTFVEGKERAYIATFKSILKYEEGNFEELKKTNAEFRAKVERGETDLWRYAAARMKNRPIQFIKSLKTVARIDDLLFTHAGPVFCTNDLDELDRYYEEKFGDFSGEKLHTTHWGHINYDTPPENNKKKMLQDEDFSASYATVADEFTIENKPIKRGVWASRAELPAWLLKMGAKHIYVGHQQQDEIEVRTDLKVTNVDGGLCKVQQGTSAGVLVIDPFAQNPVQVEGEFKKDVGGFIKDPKLRIRDVTQGRTPYEAIGNIYAKIAEIIAE